MPKTLKPTVQEALPPPSDHTTDLSRLRPADLTFAQVRIDPEFESLLDSGDYDELHKLYEEIERDPNRFRDAVVVAKLPERTLILIDGYRRYRIWKKYYNSDPARGPKIIVIDIPDRHAAELWIIRNQMCRRNLTDAKRIELALKYEPLFAAQAEKNRKGGVRLKSDEGQKSVDTNSELSEIAGVSRDTFCKGKKVFKLGTPDLVQSLKEGKLSVNAAARAADSPPEVQNQIAKTGGRSGTRIPKIKTSSVETSAPKMEAPAEHVASDSIEPRKLPYIARETGTYCRSLLSDLKKSQTSHFDSPAEVNELLSIFRALIQLLDPTALQLTTSAPHQSTALMPHSEVPLTGHPSPYKTVQFLPEHLDPRREADSDLGSDSPVAATNAHFDEQQLRFLAFLDGLEPLMQSIRESAPSNFASIDGHYQNVCKGVESLGTDLILMVNNWKLRK